MGDGVETGGDARPLPRDPGVLRTKLTPPPPWVKAVPRAQLLARLGTPRALTVICAPAGYGKTSTAVAWLASLGQRLAWVSLDRRDDDPARFLRSLAAAVRTVAPDCGRAVAAVGDRLRESDVPFLVERLLDDLHQTDAEFTLVLDDFQFLADPTILAAIETLVEGLTPKLSIVIVTREEPPLPLARWRLRGRLAELGQDELRFSPGEAEAFFNASMGLGLSSDDIARLHDRSEGWIGGLQMAALSMQGERDRATIIDAFDGRNRYVMDYLVEEVLAAQPPEIGRFLLRTSVLDRMCASLCEAVTGMPDSAAILDRLERARLFVVPLDDRREWFRYHALFADLLRHQLARSAGDRMGDCQTAASRWFERQGFIDDAAEYALAAGDAERVAAIAETYGRDMIIAGQSKRLHELLSQVPADRLAGNADRLSVALWARFNREGVCPPALLADLKAAVRADPDAARLARNASDLRLIEAIEAVRSHRDHARAIALVTPEEGAQGFASPLAQSIAPTLLAAAAHKSGDRARATASYAGAVDAALGQRAVTTFFLSALGLGRLTSALRGPKAGLKDLERARSTAERMGWGDLPFMSWLLCGEAECAEEMDDPVGESLYTEAIRLARLEPPVVRHVARLGLAGLLWRSGRRDEADAALEELSRVPYAEPFMPVLPDFEVAWARHDLARGRFDRTTDLIKRRELSTETLSPGATDEEALLIGRWLIQKNRPGAATAVLTALLERAEPEGWLETSIRARIDLAAARAMRGEGDTAAALISRALAEGGPAGYVRSFLDAPRPVAVAIAALAASGDEGAAAAVSRRLAARPEAPRTGTSGGLLSPRERRVLQLLSLGFTNRELAERLFVSENTVKTHLKSVYGKIGARNRAEAAVRAQALGLSPAEGTE